MSRLTPLHLLLAANLLLVGTLAWTNAQSQTPDDVPDVLRAHAIELVNERGDVVAQLYVGDGGSGQLRLRNGAGEVRVKLGPSNDGNGAALLLMDAATGPAVQLRAAADGASLLLDGKAVAP